MLQLVDSETAEEFGVEIGGFLRHHSARECHVGHLLNGGRLQQESHIGSVANFVVGGIQTAHILDVPPWYVTVRLTAADPAAR